MGLLGAISFSIALVSLTQIPFSKADCPITSAVSAGPSAILVKWNPSPTATNYILDLRVTDNTEYSPVLTIVPVPQTEKKVQGLRPGTNYTVTLKVLQFMVVQCTSNTKSCTVPDTAQITSGFALSSSAISLEWTAVPSAEHFYLVVHSQSTRKNLNLTYTTTSAVVNNLQPSTNYDCYVYSANMAGVGYASKVRTITTLVKPPIGIKAVQTGRNEAVLTWLPVEDVLMYRVSIQEANNPASIPTVYNVTGTSRNLKNIQSCSEYLIKISSYNMFLVPSEPNDYTYTTNTLESVSRVTVQYSCTSDSVTVTWVPVQGADSYKAKAVAEGGATLGCTGTLTSCVINGLSCGKTYEVHVTPISANCENQVNSTYATFQSVPCPPQNLSLLRSCDSDVILFSWELSNNTQVYKAKSVDSKGVVQECLTEDNSCYFTQTHCGRHYYFSVYSMSGDCNSAGSDTVDISTAPCIPQNVQTFADCNSHALVSKWDLAEGAQNYTVEAFGNVGNGSYYTCHSHSNSCSFQNMMCGEALTIHITSHNEHCSSPRALAPVAQTVPCVPQNVIASTDCEANAMTVNWDMATGAIFYMVEAEDSNGNWHTCYTLDLTCTIEGLSCSTNYTISVMASNMFCNSSMSDTVSMETVACPPSNIVSTLDCANNEALISWNAEPRIPSFTATALDENNRVLSCNSVTTSCKISNLQCDQRYTVTVGNHDSICPIIDSAPVYMDSVPCGPAVTADVDCGTQVMTASWDPVTNATSYEIQLSDGTTEQDFSITSNVFTSSNLECGKTYTLDVHSVIDGCISHATQVTVTQAPCAPTNIAAQTVCPQTHADVTWQSSLGAVWYEVTAVSSGAPQQQCNSTGTSCQLEGLECSQTYNITATAWDDQCHSKTSAETQLVTEPCPPTGLVVALDCASNSAVLSWDNSPNAMSYTGTASSASGYIVTCDANAALSCNLDDLECGQTYDFTVMATDGNCHSAESQAVTYSTAPCAVTSVTNTLDCSTNALTTSWTSGDPSLNYTVKAEKADGTVLTCNTDKSSCVLSGLPCGAQYSVTVVPISSTCTGQSSDPDVVNTAPCIPSNISLELQCSDNTLHSSWELVAGATSYLATLSGDWGFSKECPSFIGFCSFNYLQCAKTYTLDVAAGNDRCNSSATRTFQSAPCDPTDVTTSLDCASGVATVSWTASAGADSYTVLAQASDHKDICGTTGTSCELHNLRCGKEYDVIIMAGDNTCNSTILTTSTITTAPCAPVTQPFSLDCATNEAVVPWMKDDDAQSVTVSAVSSLGHSASCNSTDDNSCVLTDLQCGNTYTVTAVAEGVQCDSEPSTPFEIITAPCTPQNLDITNSCETGIAIVRWDETLGRKSFYVTATSPTDVKTCSTSTTDCDLSAMVCGQTYDINVFAIADHCNSSLPASTQMQTAPCPPQNIAASLLCENNTASVTWTASPTAVSYTVKALSRDDKIKECSSNTTTCDIPNMQCGETYRITVTPFSDECQGYESQPYEYLAGPCPPSQFTVARQCSGNVAVVSWTAVPNAEYYEASALELVTPHTHNCSSSSTTCSITNLHCGETVAVTVLTKERGCWSEPNQPFMFEAVICPPAGLTAVTTCSNNDITVSWNASPKTGVTYLLDSTKFGGSSQQYSTSSTSHVISGLQCGELYTLQTSAQYQECTSALSSTIEAETAPCPPTDLSATTDCGTSSGTLTWTQSVRATHYTATFTGSRGGVTTCTSNSTSCTVKLDCGEQYTASLIASSDTCDSSSAATLVFSSAPCLPDNVVATLDCAANSFAVTWNGNSRDGPFTALAIGSDDSRVSCDSQSTECTINSLKCGVLYSIVVTTANVNCGVINDSDYKVHSAPCKPTAVSLDLDCDTNNAVVGWEGNGPDQEQEVIARDIRGNTISCNSSASQCAFTGLTCGLSYNISVVGKSNTCTSAPTYGPMLHTAPCLPTRVKTTYDCEAGITIVSWDAANGATSYTVEAKGSLGYNDQCQNTDTNCDLPSLACGQAYNITVQAINSHCTSAVSETVVSTTGPCPHSSVDTNLDCGANIIVVSWTPGSGILYYNATALALDTLGRERCSTNSSSCNISTLLCGESYSVSVSGQGLTCPSPAQGWQRIKAAPCPPTLLSVNSSCDSDNITVNWAAAKGAVTYRAVAENKEGVRWTCESGGAKCNILGLPCGQTFNVYVTGLDGDCEGARGNVEVIDTAPCVPQKITTDLDCPTGSLNVSWDIIGAMPQSMEFYIYDPSGKKLFCIQMDCLPSDGNCIVPNQQCGMNYDVKLKAVGTKCNSSKSAAQPISTAPCPLPSFDAAVACDSGLVSVTWADGMAGVVYTVSAVGADGAEHSCSSSSGGCDLDALQCGSEYNVTITPSRDECVGTSSAPQTVRTVPCVPQLNNVEIDCLTNSVWVMGSESAGAEDYVITATDNAGVVQTFECNSTLEDMCFLPTLACSMNFTFTIQARDFQCSSPHSNTMEIETGPCSPVGIMSQVDCDGNVISISWDTVPGAVSYTATLEDFNGKTDCCTSAHNGCDISNLPCGQMYILLVTAEGRTCTSSESREMARTAPCVPENLGYKLNCANNLASLSWNHSLGGQLYKVTARSQDGHVAQCTNHKNDCELSSLQCGKTYNVTVSAEDMDCSSKPSDSVSIKTAPCTPQDLSLAIDCGASTMLASWTDSDGADSYLATVENSYGQVTSCQATTQGQCSVGTLGCGLIYHVSLVASDGHCDSPPTDVVDTPSVPCAPEHIRAMFDCQLNVAIVSWYPSDGALFYIVTGTSISGHISTCTAEATNCELENLECGDSYSIEVLAVGVKCNSTGHMNGTMETGPCVPEILSTDYSPAILQVFWAQDPGTKHYTVMAVSEQGFVSDCEPDETDLTCVIYGMKCSQTYAITLTAYNNQCPEGVTSNKTVFITTEPCPPQNVQARIHCPTDRATVQWESSVGAVSYVATLSGRNGKTLQCKTDETYCDVDGLDCSVIYYTQVIAVGETMNSTGSEAIQLEAAPCPVENVAAAADCDNSSAVITWSPVVGASSYEMIAMATDGHQATCEGSELDTECELVDLECGQTYSITAVSINAHQCRVETVTGVTFETRPCKPVIRGSSFDCKTATATLFWDEEDDVVLYNATAVSSFGVMTFCSSETSPCHFTNLSCGETYDLYLVAFTNMCQSESSETVSVQTEPCKPTGLSVQGSCTNDTVELSWFDSAGAERYGVFVVGKLGYTASLRTAVTTVEIELLCGQLYTFTVEALDSTCSSGVSDPVEYQTAPCVPWDVQTYSSCEDSTGAVSWAPTDGAEFYVAFAIAQDGSNNICTTDNTYCVWQNLTCGEVYTVFVTAQNTECGSGESNSTIIRMASCIPQNLESSFNCSMKVGYLSWDGVDTADFYIATAESNSGHKLQLSTNDTWAYFSEFSCGQEYFLSVQSVDAYCTSKPSSTSKLQSEPCPPTGVSSFMNCLANIAVVSWNASAGADYYTATVTSEEGTSHSCWSDNEQCGIPNLRCGQTYSVSVVASNEACNSDPSAESQLMSVPCVPTNVQVTMYCSVNEAKVSWDASKGALTYKVTAQDSSGMSSCETDALSCVLTDLQCGHTYNVQVVAKDDICSSLPSPTTQFSSVPCIPYNVSVVVDCVTDSFIVDWIFSEGALDYIATAETASGDVYTCRSNNTNCEIISMQCGQLYTVTVEAENIPCRSPPSNALVSESAPCPPQGLTSSLNCSSNSITAQWQQSAGVNYFVEAFGVEEDEATCTSSTDSCVLEGLPCGFIYNISVVAWNDVCNVSSNVIQQHSVPCIPQNVRAELDCESKDVQVTWENTKGALNYTSVAQGMGGFFEVCDSVDTWCTFTQLVCDMNYTITVVASDDECSGHASDPVEIYTGPCDPQGVVARMICDNNTGLVSWDEGEGVTSYSVKGYAPDGHSVSCVTTGTSCQLPNMHCGQMYNLTVTANDGRCNNSQTHVTLDSVPCSPTNVDVSLQCHSRTAAVTWELASGALWYTGKAVSADGSHTLTCNTTETYCDLSSMKCGTVYTVTVVGVDYTCSSVKSAAVTVHTASCSPQNVTVKEQCAAGSMSVSWSPNPDAEYFYVSGISSSGTPLNCNTTSTSCSFNSLPCGKTYNFIVVAFRDKCPSVPSDPVETSSAPCVPTNVNGNLDCVTNDAWITWTDSAGASSYSVFARGVGVAHNSSCTSSSSPCSVQSLKCGTVYNIQVTAENQYCPSAPTPIYKLETAPCALTAINATTECDSSVITVQWKVSENMPMYVATAEGHDMSQIMCNSTSNSCQLTNANCGMHYTVIVSTSSVKCSSLRSPPYKVDTAPCAPQNVTAVQSCGDGGVTVSYDLSPVATRYKVAVTGTGFSEVCETTFDNCTLTDLPCGEQFQVVVYALTENCTSPGTTLTYTSGPCPPSGLNVVYDCASLSAALTWDPSEDTQEYFASAQALSFSPLYCSSTDLSCTITGLRCGYNYSFIVEASDHVCNSSSAVPVHVGAVPCAPINIRVRMQLMEGRFWARIYWDRVNCSNVEYEVTIAGHINDDPQTQLHITSYWLERNYYETPLPTSSTYKINVYARNEAGVSNPSNTKTGITVPSPPLNAVYNTGLSLLSWDASVLANLYRAYEVIDGVSVVLCETPMLFCTVSPSTSPPVIKVVASNSAGTSLPTTARVVLARRRRDLTGAIMDLDETLVTPTAVSVEVASTSLTVKWSPVDDAAEYVVVVHENTENAESLVETTADTELSVHDLKPSTVYCLQVAAKNISKQSHYSEIKCISTQK